jgi:hypothetical protein
MGKAIQVSIGDIGKLMFVHGMGPVIQGIVGKHFTSKDLFALGAQEGKLAGLMMEVVSAQRMTSLMGDGGLIGRATKVEKALNTGRRHMHLFNLLGPWTDYIESLSSAMGQSSIIKASVALKAGKATARDKQLLATIGIDDSLAGKIVKQWEKHGSSEDDFFVAGTPRWDDDETTNLFRTALVTAVKRSMLTPGAADRPLLMTKPIWQMILLYKQFAFSATQRILLSSMQQRDQRVVAGLMAMTFFGWLASVARSTDYDQRGPFHPDRLKEAFDLSGIGGVFTDLDHMITVASQGTVGLGPAMGVKPKFSAESDLASAGAVAGAAVAPWMNIASVMVNDSDTSQWANAVRRMVPYNNLLYFDRLMRMAAGSAASAFESEGRSPLAEQLNR